MSHDDPLGDRMKTQYENVTRWVLPRRTYTILRLDGRAFHTVTRGLDRPFDTRFAAAMDQLAGNLCQHVAGSVFAYTQSDEISILLQDFESTGTQPWFGGNVQKIVSVAASYAGAHFSYGWPVLDSAHFDARVFTIPDPVEVANYFIWRQRDAVRNSIQMAAQAHFPHGQLQLLSTRRLVEKLAAEAGVVWDDYPEEFKRGRATTKHLEQVPARQVAGLTESAYAANVAYRTEWRTAAAEHFTCEPGGFLARTIPPLPTLAADPVAVRA